MIVHREIYSMAVCPDAQLKWKIVFPFEAIITMKHDKYGIEAYVEEPTKTDKKK